MSSRLNGTLVFLSFIMDENPKYFAFIFYKR